MTKNHDDHGDEAFVSGNDPLDSLLREWHAENASRAAAQRDKLMRAVAANAKSRLRGQLETDSTGQTRVQSQGRSAHRTLTPALSLKGEGVRPTRFARLTPAIAASLAFAATLGLLFSTAGPQSQARADVIMAPNGGRLDAVNARGELIGPCPLRHTDVHVDVSGSFARVTLQQRYGNPYADKIEAVYTFPLSHRAAVDRMTMTIGDRVVVGEVKEREAARATYEAAKSAGHAAALLEQERPNIFTQSVANIEPGVEIVVEISYVELLEARDGLFGFTFPMVVAPRYIPGGGDVVKPLLPDMVHRQGLNLLAPGTLTLTTHGDTSKNGVLTADVIHALITDAIPIETPPAEYWPRHYPTTGQPVAWHYFEVGYLDGQREPGVLYTDGLGQINGRWFYVNTSGQTWPPTAAAMPPGTQGTGFASGTSKVPDAARITPQPVMPTTRAGHDISITVNIDTGGPGITDLKSESHAVQQNWGTMRADGSPSQVAVGLNDVATIPNKDFVLHWRQTADTITEQVFTHAGAHGGFITLILNPPARVENSDAVPRELVFVLDTSGSMQGFPIQKAKEVMTKAIAALRPQDTFNLITFAGDTTILWDSPQPATPDKLAEAQAYVESRQGRGGTEMMTAINAALTVSPEQRQIAEGQPTPVRIVCFMTDGEVGNDMAIIDAVKKNAATTRVFSFGIGNSVNRYLLDGIAKAGRGAAEYVLLSEGADEKVAAFSQRIQSPVLMNVKMDLAGDIQVIDRVPEELPDLYDVSPIIVHARYTKGGKGSVTLRGDAGSGPYEKIIELDLPEAKAEHDVIATLWAREKVEQVMNRDLAAAQNGTFPDELKKQVIDLGETFQIMTQYTSFVAVENLRVTIGGQPRLVPVPIELPEGQSWEGTVGEAVNKWADEVAPEDVVLLGQVLRISPTIPANLSALAWPDFGDDSTTSTNELYSYADVLEEARPAEGLNEETTYHLKHKTAHDIGFTIEDLLRPEDGSSGPLIDEGPNEKTLIARNVSPQQREKVRLLIEAFDVPNDVSGIADAGNSSANDFVVYHLKHKTAYDIAFTIEDMLKPKSGSGPLFDEGPNEKTIIAKNVSPERREAVRKLIEMFDVPSAESAEEGARALDADKIPADLAAKMLVDSQKASQPEHPSELAESESYARMMEGYQSVRADAGRSIASNMEIQSPGATLSKKGTDIFRTWYDEDSNNAGVSNAPPSLPKPTVLAKPDEPDAAGGLVDLSRIGFGVAGARWDGFPDNPPSQDPTSPGAEQRPRVFGMIAGQPNQPPPASDGAKTSLWFDARGLPAEQASVAGQPPPQLRSRETVLGQTVTTTAQPAQLGEAHAGLPVIRYGLADSLAPTGSTGSFTRHQPVIAAAEGRQAGAVARVPIVKRYIAPPSDPAAPADETLRRSLDMNLGRGVAPTAEPNPEIMPGLAFMAASNAPSGDAGIVSSLGVDIPTAPTTAGVGGAIASNDLNGDGLPDTPTGSSNGASANTTYDGWDAGQSKFPVPGDIPAVGDAFRIAGRGVTLGMPEPLSPGTPASPAKPPLNIPGSLGGADTSGADQSHQKAPDRERIVYSVRNGSAEELSETLEQHFKEDAAKDELEKKNKELLDFRATWSVLGQGTEPNEKLMTLESVATELELDVVAKDALREQLKTEQRNKDAKMAEYQKLVKERDALSARLEKWAGATNHTNRSGQDVQYKDGHVDFGNAGNSGTNEATKPPARLRAQAESLAFDELVVRVAGLAQAGRFQAAAMLVDELVKYRPDHAVVKAMHDVLNCFVITSESCIVRLCELAAPSAMRLTASAERARLMARRLDERLLRLAVGDSTIRTHHASGGPGSATLADKPPVAPQGSDGLDLSDAGVLVSVLVDAFGDGTVSALTKAGLKIESTSKPTRVVIGRIAPNRLADLATCTHVRRVEAVKER